MNVIALSSFNRGTQCITTVQFGVPEMLYTIRWNKSFPMRSVVYSTAMSGEIQAARESLPSNITKKEHFEAIRAPYQRDDATQYLAMSCSLGMSRTFSPVERIASLPLLERLTERIL